MHVHLTNNYSESFNSLLSRRFSKKPNIKEFISKLKTRLKHEAGMFEKGLR